MEKNSLTKLLHNKKLLYIVVGCLILAIALILIFSPKTSVNPQISIQLTPVPQVILATPFPSSPIIFIPPVNLTPPELLKTDAKKREIADKILLWLDSQKAQKGNYYYNLIINSDGSRQKPKSPDNRIGTNIMWSRASYYEAAKDGKALKKLESDLKTHLDKMAVNTFQPDFWACRSLYEIEKYPNIPQSIKIDAKNLCYRSLILIPELSEDFLKDKTPITPYPETDLVNLFLFFRTNETIDQSDEPGLRHQFDKLAALSSDFNARYKWSSEGNSLVIAKSLFNMATRIYERQKSAGVTRDECLLGIASLDLYSSTNEDKYLNLAKNIYTYDILAGNRNLFRKTTCLYYVSLLNDIEEDLKYSNFMDKLLDDILSNNYDPDSGVFYTMIGDSKAIGIIENSMMSVILLKNNKK